MTSPAVLLRQARRSAGMTQSQLAVQLGISQPTISRLERSTANPTWETLARVLDATGHDVELKRRSSPPAGLDLGQIRERLRLSPSERLQLFQTSQRELNRLRGKALRHRSAG